MDIFDYETEVELKRVQYYDNEMNKKLEIKINENLNLNSSNMKEWINSRKKIYKNLIIIGLAWMFQFTAYQSMANLQSSLNEDEGLGTASLSTIYVTLILSCLFIPPIMINKLKLKWTIVISQICYLLFIAANMYPKWYILIPAAIILGVGAAPLWTAKCTYLTEISLFYSNITNTNQQSVMTKFFGIFFAMFQTTQIWGNVISSTILKVDLNLTINTSEKELYCGSNDCPGTNITAKIIKPLMSTVYILCSIYIGFTIIGILLIVIFLNSYSRPSDTEIKSRFGLVVSTVKHLKKKKQILIIPITLWLGFSQAFIAADFAKSYVNCLKGVNFVGYTLICYGVVDVIGSYLFGYLVKHIGRIPCFIIPAVINYSMIFLMLFWTIREDQVYVLFLIAGFWGLADAGWQTQIHSLYGTLFNETKEEAFSNFRLWESLGFAIAYAYSSHICVYVKLYLLIVFLTLGILGYVCIELMEKRSKRSDSIKELIGVNETETDSSNESRKSSVETDETNSNNFVNF